MLLDTEGSQKCHAGHAATFDGPAGVELMTIGSSAIVLVLCSNSSGSEDATCSVVYMLTIHDGKVDAAIVVSQKGKHYSSDKEDLWTFSLNGNKILTCGPEGPCRYGFISNMKESDKLPPITMCLATGQDQPIRGSVTITKEAVTGFVSQRCDVLVQKDTEFVYKFSKNDLNAKDGIFEFHRKWTAEESKPGLCLVHVCAVGDRVKGK